MVSENIVAQTLVSTCYGVRVRPAVLVQLVSTFCHSSGNHLVVQITSRPPEKFYSSTVGSINTLMLVCFAAVQMCDCTCRASSLVGVRIRATSSPL